MKPDIYKLQEKAPCAPPVPVVGFLAGRLCQAWCEDLIGAGEAEGSVLSASSRAGSGSRNPPQ